MHLNVSWLTFNSCHYGAVLKIAKFSLLNCLHNKLLNMMIPIFYFINTPYKKATLHRKFICIGMHLESSLAPKLCSKTTTNYIKIKNKVALNKWKCMKKIAPDQIKLRIDLQGNHIGQICSILVIKKIIKVKMRQPMELSPLN